MEQKFEILQESPADSAEKSESTREDLKEVGEKATEVAESTAETSDKAPQIPLEAPDEYATNIAEAPAEDAVDDEEGATNIIEEPGRSKDIVSDDSEKREKAEKFVEKQIKGCIMDLYDDRYPEVDTKYPKNEFIKAKAGEIKERAADLIQFISKDCNAAPDMSSRLEVFRGGLINAPRVIFIATLASLAEAKANPDKFTDNEYAVVDRRDGLWQDLFYFRDSDEGYDFLTTKDGKDIFTKIAEGMSVLADNLEPSLSDFYEKKAINPFIESMNASLAKIDSIANPKSEQI